MGLLGPPAAVSALPLVEAAAVLHAKKGQGHAQRLHAAVSDIHVASLGSDADDSEDGMDEASVESEDESLQGEEDEELYSSSDEAGVVLEGGLGKELQAEPTDEELRILGLA